MNSTRHFLIPILLALVCLAGAGCGSDLIPVAQNFRVRLMNAAPGSPRCYLSMNGVATGDTLSFLGAGRYVALTRYDQQIRIISASGALLASTGSAPVSFAPNQDNTIFLVGSAAQASYDVRSSIDNRDNGIGAGEVDLRVFHLVPNLSADVKLILDGSVYGALNQAVVDLPYNRFLSGGHIFKFISVSDTSTVYATRSVNLAAGLRYTVALTGLNASSPPLEVTVLVDSAGTSAPAFPTQSPLVHNLLK